MNCEMSPRDRQLSWLPPGSRFRQDQDLINFIQETTATTAIGCGDISYFAPYIQFIDTGPVDCCIYIQTKSFDFDDLIKDVNNIIDRDITPGGKIYLSLNKYQIVPRKYSLNLPADFDEAIGIYVEQHIKAKVDLYQPCGLDGGNKFNWIHPLTRFYLSKLHDC